MNKREEEQRAVNPQCPSCGCDSHGHSNDITNEETFILVCNYTDNLDRKRCQKGCSPVESSICKG